MRIRRNDQFDLQKETTQPFEIKEEGVSAAQCQAFDLQTQAQTTANCFLGLLQPRKRRGKVNDNKFEVLNESNAISQALDYFTVIL